MVENSELGVGVVWFGGLAPLVEAADDLIDFYEIEPATTSLPAGAQERLGRTPGDDLPVQDRKPTLVHGVSCPVGGTVAPSPSELAGLAAAAETLHSPWISEHLSIDRLLQPDGSPAATGFFLPPAQTRETVELAVQRLHDLAQVTGRPVAFETGVNYFAPLPGHMEDGEFFAAIAEQADCLILLDLHNLWCNEHNGRQPIRDVIASLPLERICEVHLAGGQRRDGFLLDAHSALVEPALTELSTEIIAQLPALRALTFELVPDYVKHAGIDIASYRRQLEELQRLWDARGRACQSGRTGRPTPMGRSAGLSDAGAANCTPPQWEEAIASALRGEPGPLATDPGTALYTHLIEAVRSGAVVTAMPLTFRYMVSALGIEAAEATLARYQGLVAPSAWALDEAVGFADYVQHSIPVPHIDEVARFELAAYETHLTNEQQTVTFTCEPTALLDALRAGRRPPAASGFAGYEVTVTP